MASEITGQKAGTPSTLTNNPRLITNSPPDHHSCVQSQCIDSRDPSNSLLYHPSPHITRPPFAYVHDHRGRRTSPNWPYDHRHSGIGPSHHSPHNRLCPASSTKSQTRHASRRAQTTLDVYDGKSMGISPSAVDNTSSIPSRPTLYDTDKTYISTSAVPHTSPVEPLRVSYSHLITHDLEAAAEAQKMSERGYTRQTLRSLIHLGLSAPFTSLVACLYTILILVYVLFTTPFHLCSSDPFKTAAARVLLHLLGPLNFQRRCIFAPPIPFPTSPPSPSKAHTENSTAYPQGAEFRLPCNTAALIFTHLLSPFVSIPLGLGAWATAAAWLPSAMLSHERAGGVSDDERRMAERLVGMWSSWLDWCVVDIEQERRGRNRGRGGRSRADGGSR